MIVSRAYFIVVNIARLISQLWKDKHTFACETFKYIQSHNKKCFTSSQRFSSVELSVAYPQWTGDCTSTIVFKFEIDREKGQAW